MRCRDGCDSSVRIIYQDKKITKLKCDKCGGVYTWGTGDIQETDAKGRKEE